MAVEIRQKVGTLGTWNGAGTTGSLVTIGTAAGISLENKTTGTASQGAKMDLGATRAAAYGVKLRWRPNSTHTAVGTVDVYFSQSTSATIGSENEGGANVTGADAAFTAPAGSSIAEKVAQMTYVGSLPTSIETSNEAQVKIVGILYPSHRYVCPVIVNNSGVTSNTTDNTSNFQLELLPIVDESQ